MDRRWAACCGSAIGAGLMYFLDPVQGRRRRSGARDKAVSLGKRSAGAAETAARDIRHRMRGVIAEFRPRIDEAVPDDVLVARIRSIMGRIVSHPHAIEVTANQGVVTMRGPVLQDEGLKLLRRIRSVSGIRAVENRLETHAEPGDVPELQGGSTRIERRFDLMQTNWALATRLIMGITGGLLAVVGARRRNPAGIALAATGGLVLARSITNMEINKLLGIQSGPTGISLQKTITIAAPIDYVYGLWTDYEHFPKFMSHVREVTDLGNGRSRWVVDGPAGIPVEWTAAITRAVPEQVLAWRTDEGSVVQHKGTIYFQPDRNAGTRVHVRFSYNPPAGAAGHALAVLLGTDPRRRMEDDLVRMKIFVETGIPPRDAAVKPQQLTPGW